MAAEVPLKEFYCIKVFQLEMLENYAAHRVLKHSAKLFKLNTFKAVKMRNVGAALVEWFIVCSLHATTKQRR